MKDWLASDPFTQCGATAYYAVFSMPGLLIMIMAIASQFFEHARVETEVLEQITAVLGSNVADSVEKIIDETQFGNRDRWAMLVGIITLFFGATGVFAQLQRSLNYVWGVEVRKSAGFIQFLKARATAFGIILAIGFLLLISLSVTAALTLLSEWLYSSFPLIFVQSLSIINFCVSFLIIGFLFSLIFKFLPDVKVLWKEALHGGALSAVLFTLGQYALTYYFDVAKPQSTFGAAGSIILLMIWVSYSCLILLLGAEFSKAYANYTRGENIETKDFAKKKQRF